MAILPDKLLYYFPDIEQKIIADEPPFIRLKDKHCTQIRLGKWLKKQTDLNDAAIKIYVEQYKAVNAQIADYVIQLRTDYVDIYQIELFAIGSRNKSCMTGSESVQVYSYDDRLAIFCVYFNQALCARTLVRSDSMQYVRIYLDNNLIKSEQVIELLNQSGYIQGNLAGIELGKIEYNQDNEYLMPYIDGLDSLEDCGDYFLITGSGSLSADSTRGILVLYSYSCEACGCSLREDEGVYIEESDIEVCESCYHNNYIYFDSIDRTYAISNCIELDNEYYPADRLSDFDIVELDSGNYCKLDEAIYLDYLNCYALCDDTVCLAVEWNEDYCILSKDAIELESNELLEIESGYYHIDQLKELVEEFNTNRFNEVTIVEYQIVGNEVVTVLQDRVSKLVN